jgi:hypothetical protein
MSIGDRSALALEGLRVPEGLEGTLNVATRVFVVTPARCRRRGGCASTGGAAIACVAGAGADATMIQLEASDLSDAVEGSAGRRAALFLSSSAACAARTAPPEEDSPTPEEVSGANLFE